MTGKGFFGEVYECHSPTGESVSWSETGPEHFKSTLTKEDLGTIQGFFFILAKFEVELVESGERVHHSPLD